MERKYYDWEIRNCYDVTDNRPEGDNYTTISICSKEPWEEKTDFLENLYGKLADRFIQYSGYTPRVVILDRNDRFREYAYDKAKLHRSFMQLKSKKIELIVLEFVRVYEVFTDVFQKQMDHKNLADIGNDIYIKLFVFVDWVCRIQKNAKTENVFRISVSNRLMPGFMSQEEWVALLKEACCELSCSQGMLEQANEAFANSAFPMEKYQMPSLEVIRYHDTKLRGYFWGNVLSEKHVERLGGIDRIKEEAPCYLVEEIQSGDRQLVYLQATERLGEFTEEKRMELKKYLEPLLYRECVTAIYTWNPNRNYQDMALAFDEEQKEEWERCKKMTKEELREICDKLWEEICENYKKNGQH